MPSKSHKKQPISLYYLFLVELWERFGFYTMRGLLVLYLTNKLLFTDDQSYALFGAFTALIWLTPAFGGLVADKLIGYRWAVKIGGGLLALGYALMAIPSETMFYLSMSILLIGNGFFKATVSSLVGLLYDDRHDPRRDGGFTIFYMGINVGGLLGPLVSGYVASQYGWGAGFLTAAAGMLLGLITFILGQPLLKNKGLVPDPARLRQKLLPGISQRSALVIVTLLAIGAGYLLMYHVVATDIVLALLSVLILCAYITATLRQSKLDRNRMLGSLILVIFSIAFWVLYQQAPMTVNLFTERNVDRHLFGFTVPAVMFQSLNPLFIILFTPVLNYTWNVIAQRRWYMPTALKFTLGIFLMAAGFLILNGITKFSHTGIISAWWVVLSYLLQSVGELALSPIGLAMMTKMAPKNTSGLMLGTWFLASALSNAIAGIVAQIASITPSDSTPLASAEVYGHAFGLYGWSAVIVGVIALLCVPWLSRMMGEQSVASMNKKS